VAKTTDATGTRGQPGPVSALAVQYVNGTAPLAEKGVTGTVNWDGRILAENNPALKDWLGLGRDESWGAWERLVHTDADAESALGMTVAPLRDASVEVEPAGKDAVSVAQADFVRDNLREWLEPSFSDWVERTARGFLTFGFSLDEVVHATRPDSRVPGGQAYYVAKLAERLPSSLVHNPWREGEDGELREVVQQGARAGRYESNIAIPAEKLLLVSWKRHGNNFAGYSAFRPVWYVCKVRDALLRILAIGHERESCGVPTAELEKDVSLTSEQWSALEALLANIAVHEKSYGVLPPGVKLTWFVSAAKDKGGVLDSYFKLGELVHRLFQTQQVALGSTETGSRAVGEVHDSGRRAFVFGVKAALEAVLNGVGRRPYTGLVGKMVRPNWGPVARLPKVKLVLERGEVDAVQLSTAVATLKQSGALTWRGADENALRGKLGLERIDEAERAAAQAAVAPAPPAQEAPPADMFGFAAAPPAVWRPKRPLRAEERHLKLADMARYLDTARDTFEEEARPLVQAALVQALPQVRAAMADGNPADVAEVELDLSALEDAVDEFLERNRAEGFRQARGEKARQPRGLVLEKQRSDGKAAMSAHAHVHRFAGEEEEREEDRGPAFDDAPEPPPGDITPADGEVQRPAEVKRDVRGLMKSMRANLVRRMRARMVDDLEREAIDVVRTGGNPAEVVERVVAKNTTSRVLRQDAGVVLTKSFNVGREEFAQENGDAVEAVTYSAILDGKQCSPCDQMDGRVFGFNSPEHEAAVPPLRDCEGGANCRCLLIMKYREPGFRKVDEP